MQLRTTRASTILSQKNLLLNYLFIYLFIYSFQKSEPRWPWPPAPPPPWKRSGRQDCREGAPKRPPRSQQQWSQRPRGR